MSSIFSKIIKGEIEAHIVAEDENCIAFLDISPLAPGHTLAVTKKEVDYIFDLADNDYLSLMKFVKKLARAMEKAVECKRIGLTVIGLEVPHTHVHLVPLNRESDIHFGKTKEKISEEEMKRIAGKIKEEFFKS